MYMKFADIIFSHNQIQGSVNTPQLQHHTNVWVAVCEHGELQNPVTTTDSDSICVCGTVSGTHVHVCMHGSADVDICAAYPSPVSGVDETLDKSHKFIHCSSDVGSLSIQQSSVS